MFKKIKSHLKYKDPWLALYQDEVEYPNGEKGTYAWTARKNGACIVVVTTDKKILLNKEYRYVINDFSWEIPGGGIDEGENPKDAAIRELYEETGINVNNIEKIGLFYPLNSFNTESITLFLARIEPVQLTTAKTESGEEVTEQKYVDFDKALEMIDTGEITDAFTANAIQIVIRKLS